jgi:hypothetical protein
MDETPSPFDWHRLSIPPLAIKELEDDRDMLMQLKIGNEYETCFSEESKRGLAFHTT